MMDDGQKIQKIIETCIRVRYAETDQMGVVYHANYLVWFEVGRVEWLRQNGFEYKKMEMEDDIHIAVVRRWRATSTRSVSPRRTR